VKLNEITIKPKSAFGTPIKGDTLFGHFCWQAAYNPDLIKGGLAEALQSYAQVPFAVFSSAFPKCATGNGSCIFLTRPVFTKKPSYPAMDAVARKDVIKSRKEDRARKWVVFDRGKPIDVANAVFLKDDEVCRRIVESLPENLKLQPAINDESTFTVRLHRPHNSINRCSGTTGTGAFAPFATEVDFYYPGMELAVFVCFDDSVTDIDKIVTGMKNIGSFGFGRDASTGMGRFDVAGVAEMELPDCQSADAMLALGPVVPEKGAYRDLFFTPFVRFGKHGANLAASEKPFKKPVIMADEGAVLVPEDRTLFEKPWVGSAVENVSYVQKQSVVQGYAPWLPLKIGA
jgi:CRISPR-associated protein Csm4